MTDLETVSVINLIRNTYGNFKGLSEKDLDVVVNTWSSILGEYSYSIILNALKQHIATNVYPPKPADILNTISKSQTDQTTAGEAWEILRKNIGKYGFYNAHEGYTTLPEKIKKSVDTIGGYSYLCTSDNLMSDRAKFSDNYNIFKQREDDQAKVGKLESQLSELINKEMPALTEREQEETQLKDLPFQDDDVFSLCEEDEYGWTLRWW